MQESQEGDYDLGTALGLGQFPEARLPDPGEPGEHFLDLFLQANDAVRYHPGLLDVGAETQGKLSERLLQDRHAQLLAGKEQAQGLFVRTAGSIGGSEPSPDVG